ncbi:DUF5801 repeats-in-toxin domain-containing protein, partial [Vreelandella janggokensis]|uniref:DUF5801 repeats-in-toxin domain-containing protein n=1 Tax=Vreelandella janggokensis TaxID=370767 RepID=UPI00285775D1
EDVLQLVQTLTDADGDSDSATLDLSDGVFTIRDDAPTAEQDGNFDVPAFELNESDALNDDGVRTQTQELAGAFGSELDYGSDGEGSVDYALTLSGESVNTGLYALDPSNESEDNPGQGAEIVLVDNDGTIEGRADGEVIFTISTDGEGNVTFSQSGNLWHPQASDSDESANDPVNLSLEAGVLQLVQTLTDADGDSDSATLDLSDGVFTIRDDAPTAEQDGDFDVPAFELNESDALNDDGVRTQTQELAGAFGSELDYGSDGEGSVDYALTLSGENVPTGLFALDAEAENGQGAAIVLVDNDGTIEGQADGEVIFTISTDGEGNVTFSQSGNLWHPQASDSDESANDPVNLSLEAGVLQLVQTLTDADGDSDSATLDLSDGVFT